MPLVSLHSVNDVNFQNSVSIAALIHTIMYSGAWCLWLSNLFNSWHLNLLEKFEEEGGIMMRQNTTELTQRSVCGCHFLIHFIFKKWKTNLPTKSLSMERVGRLTSSGKGHRGYTKFLPFAFALSSSAELAWPVRRSGLSSGYHAVHPFRLLTALLGLHKSSVHFVKTSLSKNGNFALLLFH